MAAIIETALCAHSPPREATFGTELLGLQVADRAIYLVCAALLAIGFMTRYAALPLLLLSLITQLRYTPFDTHLFWMALAGWLAIYGAGPISVDNLLRRGLNDSRPAHSTNYRLFRAPESMRHAAVLLFLPGVVGNRFAHVGYFALLGR